MSERKEGESGMGWWLVERGASEPKPVQVLRHSASSVWLPSSGWRHKGEKRCNRIGEWTSYFPTETEAVAYIRHDLATKVERAKAELHRHRTALGQVDAYARRRGLNVAAPTAPPDPPSLDPSVSTPESLSP
jgi:hypothetical protein